MAQNEIQKRLLLAIQVSADALTPKKENSQFNMEPWIPNRRPHGESSAEEETPKWSFYFISNTFLALLCLVTLAGMVKVTHKAKQLVWPHEKMIPFMLVFLCLSLLGGFTYFSWSLLRVYSYPFPSGTEMSHEQICEQTAFPFIPVFFLTIAVILNINKWIYFYVRVIAYSKSLENDY